MISDVDDPWLLGEHGRGLQYVAKHIGIVNFSCAWRNDQRYRA